MEEEACCSKDVASTSDSCSFSAGASTLSDGRDSDIDSEEGKDQERRRVVSLLDRLKAPSVADISRPRKTKKNESPHRKRQCKGAVSSDPKGVSPAARKRIWQRVPHCIAWPPVLFRMPRTIELET